MQRNFMVVIFVILILFVLLVILNRPVNNQMVDTFNPNVNVPNHFDPQNIINTIDPSWANKDTVLRVIRGKFVPAGSNCLTAEPLTGGLIVLQDNNSQHHVLHAPALYHTQTTTLPTTMSSTTNPYPGITATSTVTSGQPNIQIDTTGTTAT